MPTAGIDGLRVNYTDAGSGLPVVFVPGLVGSKEWFHYQTLTLSDHYRIISYDLRRARGGCTLSLLADDLVRLLNALRIPAAVVAGHELGALVALRFAADHPDRCIALITVGAAASFAGVSEDDLLSQFSPREIEFDGFFARLWKRLRPRKPEPDDDLDPLSYLSRHTADIDRPTLDARLRVLRQTSLEDILDGVNAPTLVVTGSDDSPKVLAGSQILDERIPDSTLEVIENADHFCFFTRYDLFNSVVVDFLNSKAANP